MPAMSEWRVPPDIEPRPDHYSFDLRQALASVVSVSATVPQDAFSAETLGTERAGHGVLIREDGIIVTIGYLITEADQIWLTTGDGRLVQGHALGYDAESGLGLVQALGRLQLPVLPIGRSSEAAVGSGVVAAGVGGLEHSVAAVISAKQEFAGYWEYLLDEAIFTTPAHPFWGGSALIGPAGDLLGIGSLQLQQTEEDGSEAPLNMFVPIDLLKPVFDDLVTIGRPNRPSRPWLGFYAADNDGQTLIAGLAPKGPAARSDLRRGDIVLAVGGKRVSSLAGLFRGIWALGDAGVVVPLTIRRDGRTMEMRVSSADRRRMMRGPSLH